MGKFKVKFSKNVRTELLGGREHLVVPTIPIIEGVHNWTLLMADALEESVHLWNTLPITYNHPEDKYGWPTFIDNRDLADKYITGIILNARFNHDGIEWESWFDKELLKGFNESSLIKLEKGEMEEGSVGYWSIKTEFVEGEWNGECYWAIDREIIPNHYALLGDEGTLGACSIADGCGCNRTYQQMESREDMKLFRVQHANKLFQNGGVVDPSNIEIDNSKESACQRQWSNANIKQYESYIDNAINTNELYQDFHLSDDNFPHHVVVNGKMIINVDAIKGYKSLHDSGKQPLGDIELNHLKTHFDELELDWGDTKFEFENNDDDIDTNTNLEIETEEVVMNEKLKALIEKYGEEKALELLSVYDDVEQDTVEKLIGFEKKVGVEKIGKFITDFEEAEALKVKELSDLRAEMIKDFEMEEKVVNDMGLNALKAVKEKLVQAKKAQPSNYSLNPGGGNNAGKEVTYIPVSEKNK